MYEDGPYIATGLNESQIIGSVKVYPNPADGSSSHLEYSISLAQGATVSLFDISGKEVLRQANSPQQIDVSSLQNVIYLLNVSTIGGVTTQKVMINK